MDALSCTNAKLHDRHSILSTNGRQQGIRVAALLHPPSNKRALLGHPLVIGEDRSDRSGGLWEPVVCEFRMLCLAYLPRCHITLTE